MRQLLPRVLLLHLSIKSERDLSKRILLTPIGVDYSSVSREYARAGRLVTWHLSPKSNLVLFLDSQTTYEVVNHKPGTNVM